MAAFDQYELDFEYRPPTAPVPRQDGSGTCEVCDQPHVWLLKAFDADGKRPVFACPVCRFKCLKCNKVNQMRRNKNGVQEHHCKGCKRDWVMPYARAHRGWLM